MGQVFGSTDGLNAQGQKLGSNASADDLGISSGQLFARKALQGGLAGLGRGLSQQGQQRSNLSRPISIPQTPQVSPSMFMFGQGNNPYFGG